MKTITSPDLRTTFFQQVRNFFSISSSPRSPYQEVREKIAITRRSLLTSEKSYPEIMTRTAFVLESFIPSLIPFWHPQTSPFQLDLAQLPCLPEASPAYWITTLLQDAGWNLNRRTACSLKPVELLHQLDASTVTFHSSLRISTLGLPQGISLIAIDRFLALLIKCEEKSRLLFDPALPSGTILDETPETSSLNAIIPPFHLLPLTRNPGLLHHWLKQKKLSL